MGRNLLDNPLLLIILLLIIVLVFGAKRLPDAARSVGRSMRIFKTEVKEMKDDNPDKDRDGGPAHPLEGRVVPGDDASRHSHDRQAQDRQSYDRQAQDRQSYDRQAQDRQSQDRQPHDDASHDPQARESRRDV